MPAFDRSKFPIETGADVKDDGVCIILYGKAGAGKTPIAATAVQSERFGHPMLYVDAEAGRKSIAHYTNIDFLSVNKWAQVDAIMDELEKPDQPYKCVVFDNLSELRETHMRTSVGTTEPQFQHYKKNTEGITTFVRKCRDYSEKFGISFILILWDTDEKDEGLGITVKKLELTPSLQDVIPGMVDIIGMIEPENDQSRTITFEQNRRTVSKFRKARYANAQKIPLKLTVRDPDMPVLADILNTLKGGDDFPIDRYTRKGSAPTTNTNSANGVVEGVVL